MLVGAEGMFRACEQDAQRITEDASMVVNFLLWCLFGLIAGAIAQFILPGRDVGGSSRLSSMAITIVIGIVGAVVGGLICKPLFGWDVTGFNWQSMLVAIGGALLLLILYRIFARSVVRA